MGKVIMVQMPIVAYLEEVFEGWASGKIALRKF